MLDTQFPRILGDVGNQNSYDYPVQFKTVTNVGVVDVVTADGLSQSTENAFVRAAKELQDEGAKAIITSCGFLYLLQDVLTDKINIPFFSSSLLLLPDLLSEQRNPGIITANKPALTARFKSSTPLYGLERSKAFAQAVLADGSTLDKTAICEDVVRAAKHLKAEGADCILLECTNLPPYKSEIETKTSLPVYSIFDLANKAMARKNNPPLSNTLR